MFYVESKEPENYFQRQTDTRTQYKVYDIQYKNGYPFFLLFVDGQWITRSAKHYVPISE